MTIQQQRLFKMLAYSLAIGVGAAATAYVNGVTDWHKLLAAGIVALSGAGGGYWATSPKTPPTGDGGNAGGQ